MRFRLVVPCLLLLLCAAACAPRIQLFGGSVQDPLKEEVVQGKGRDKIALIHLRGIIRLQPSSGLLSSKPGTVQEIEARLRLAAKDKRVKAVILAIESPGGGVTASDILHHAITRFKEKTKKPVIAAMLGVAASGGYYTAVACDHILAHPTTTTGSIGTIFIRPDVSGLMDLVGVQADVTKSGRLKDMASPFRNATAEERQLLQDLIDENNARFLNVVQRGRNLTPQQLKAVADARILTAQQAKDAGLVDQVGYLEDAVNEAKKRASLEQAKIVVYRRGEVANETLYTLESASPDIGGDASLRTRLLSLLAADKLMGMEAGFYWLWMGENPH